MASTPKLVGILGDPVAHSWSPVLQQAAFAAKRLNYYYMPFRVKRRELAGAMRAIRVLGLVGVNVTIPHKERVMNYLDELTREAAQIGAVNTIVNSRGRLVGHNTDGRGFTLALRRKLGMTIRGRRVCLLGAGGAARAVATTLALDGVDRIVLANRTLSRAVSLRRHLLRRLGRSAPDVRAIRLNQASLAREADGCDCLINTTAVGLRVDDPRIVPSALVRKFSYVCDLIYNPAVTPLIRDANAAGCRTMNGLAMLVYQGALAFELWTHQRPPLAAMERAARSLMKRVVRPR